MKIFIILFLIAYGLGFTAKVISNVLFHFNLNKYNSVEHFAVGIATGTYVYRKAYHRTGSRIRGVAEGLIAGTALSAIWEFVENRYVFQEKEITLDTMTDIASVFTGNMISFLAERRKEYTNKNKRDEKWVL